MRCWIKYVDIQQELSFHQIFIRGHFYFLKIDFISVHSLNSAAQMIHAL
jgi:hypothetical protein